MKRTIEFLLVFLGVIYAPEIIEGIKNLIEKLIYPSRTDMEKEIERVMAEKGLESSDLVSLMLSTRRGWTPSMMGHRQVKNLHITREGVDYNYVPIYPKNISWLRMMTESNLRELYKTVKGI